VVPYTIQGFAAKKEEMRVTSPFTEGSIQPLLKEAQDSSPIQSTEGLLRLWRFSLEKGNANSMAIVILLEPVRLTFIQSWNLSQIITNISKEFEA
jgi:hypothetical protein